VRDPALLLVRVLEADEALPENAHEAFLMPAQAGVDVTEIKI
jgi:hypothetical protein